MELMQEVKGCSDSREEEEEGHLFFNCKRIVGMWWESMTWVQAQGTLPASPVDHFPVVGF